MATVRIDAHHHLWRVDRGDYHWMPDDGPLQEDYLADRLLPELADADIGGTILVQAAQTVDETRFLLDQARDIDQVLGVTGWVDLERDDAMDTVAALATQGPMLAVRPMLHDLDDPAWIARPAVIDNLRGLVAAGQRFEVLSFPEHLPAAYEALTAVPDLPAVIDHLSKPSYNWDRDADWRVWMLRFAERPGTFCKLSGMVTEVETGWSAETFRPYAEFVLEAFGSDRVMFGSDWPVCRQAAEYGEVVELAQVLIDEVAPSAADAIWRTTAERFYGVTTDPGRSGRP